MAEPTKLQVKTDEKKGQPATLPEWRPSATASPIYGAQSATWRNERR